MSKRKKPSGAANLKAAGKSPLLLGLTAEEKQRIRIAAAHESVSMSQFLITHGLKAAEKYF